MEIQSFAHYREQRTQTLNGPSPLTPGPADRTPKDFLDLRRMFQALIRERWLILAALFVALLGVTIYFISVPAQYSAVAQVLIDIQKPKVLRGDAIVPDLDTSRFMIGAVIDSEVEILRSPPLIARVIRQLKLDQDPYFAPGLMSVVRRSVMSFIGAAPVRTGASGQPNAADARIGPPPVDPELVALVETFLTSLDVRRKGLTLIFQVTFTHTDPTRAALIANTLVAVYIDEQHSLKKSISRRAAEGLRERVAELQNEVREAELRVQDYRKEHALVNIAGVAVGEREITDLLAQLATSRTDAANKLVEKEEVEGLLSDPNNMTSIGRVLKSELITQLRQQESQIMRKLAILVTQYGGRHDQVLRTQAELRDLRRDIDQESRRLIISARHESTVADGRVRLLEQKLAELNAALATKNRLTVKLSELERQAKAGSDLYLSMLSRLEDAQTQENLISADSRVVAQANAPSNPTTRKALILALALMGGFGLGIGLALLKDHMSGVIRSPAEIASILRMPHIASVPMSGAKGVQILREVLRNRSSPFSQAIFALKHWLSIGGNRAPAKIVAVLSALPDAGKTAIASNLAHYAAVSKLRTLLIDCDLRNPKLTADLFPSPQHSLIDILAGKADAGEVIKRVEESGLFFCPGPHRRGSLLATEILASREMSDFLDAARKDYDLIVLDTSPLLPVVDTRALVDLVDVALLVVECGRLTTDNVLELLRSTPALAEKAVGVVFNRTTEIRYAEATKLNDRLTAWPAAKRRLASIWPLG